MPRYRTELPQSRMQPFLTDGGIETTLIFHYGLELPAFAAFPLLDTASGQAALHRYFSTYADLARRLKLGLVLESPTWRASSDWAAKLGYSLDRLPDVQRRSIMLMEEFRALLDLDGLTTVISGNLGPRGDGYVPSGVMTVAEAAAYHRPQIEAFANTEADLVSALTLNYLEEAIGIALAARAVGMPVVLSFTVETDGRLPTGDTLQRVIEVTDTATDAYPAYYMVNCAHPTHVLTGLSPGGPWRQRVRGIRANASPKSHAELNEATALDEGEPVAFGAFHAELSDQFPALCVIGGCCGTDQRHVEQACLALMPKVLGR
jgi:S-methylmethionine-dependent homocysteine/selenocysteine methylase